MPVHIGRHSSAVKKVAVFLARELSAKGIDINIDLVEKASLLHDILRICDTGKLDYSLFKQEVTEDDKLKWSKIMDQYKSFGHEDAAYEFLKDKYPKLALVIKRHRYSGILEDGNKPESWEEKIVYYADKRVRHDFIESLDQRLSEAHHRTRNQPAAAGCRDLTEKVDALIFEMEKDIFEKLDFAPDDVTAEFIEEKSKT